MPIQLNAPDFSGLGRYAGSNPSSVNVSAPGALGLQSLQVSNQAQNAALDRQQQAQDALMRNANQQAQQGLLAQQMQQQGLLAQQKMAQDAQQVAAGNALDQQKLVQQGSQFGQSFGLDQQKQALDEQKQNMAQQQQEMVKLASMKQEDLNKRGAFASYGIIAMKEAKTPDEANQIRTSMVQEALSNKYITSDQAKSAMQMPISQYIGSLGQAVMAAGIAKEHQDMVASLAPPKSTNGLVSITRPDGSVENYSPATKPNQTAAQNDITFSNDNSKELHQIYDNVPDSFFGATALKQPVTAVREWAQSVPVIGNLVGPNKEDKKQLETFSGINGASEMLAMKVIKQLSGVQYSDKQLEFMKEILPSVGAGTVKSVFEGKAQNLFRLYDQIKQDRADLLAKGFKLDTEEHRKAYADEMLNRIQGAANAVSTDPIRQQMIDAGHPAADVDAFLASKRGAK